MLLYDGARYHEKTMWPKCPRRVPGTAKRQMGQKCPPAVPGTETKFLFLVRCFWFTIKVEIILNFFVKDNGIRREGLG